MAGKSVAVYGDNCIDRYRLVPPFDHVGGSSLNVAVHLAAQGAQVAYFGVTGDDEDGRTISRSLNDRGIDCTHLVRRRGKTAVTEIELNHGDRIFAAEDLGVQIPLRLTPDHLLDLASFPHVHCSGFTSWKIHSQEAQPDIVDEMAFLRARDCFVSFDFSEQARPALARLIGGALGVAFASLGSTASPDQVAETLCFFQECRVPEVVVTLGAAGAVYSSGHSTFRLPSSTCNPVDTLGAGDSFIAGWLWGRMLGEPPAERMQRATRIAGAVCMHFGAWPDSETLVNQLDGGDQTC